MATINPFMTIDDVDAAEAKYASMSTEELVIELRKKVGNDPLTETLLRRLFKRDGRSNALKFCVVTTPAGYWDVRLKDVVLAHKMPGKLEEAEQLCNGLNNTWEGIIRVSWNE